MLPFQKCVRIGGYKKMETRDVSRKDLLATLRELPYQTWLSESVEDGAIDYPSAKTNGQSVSFASKTKGTYFHPPLNCNDVARNARKLFLALKCRQLRAQAASASCPCPRTLNVPIT